MILVATLRLFAASHGAPEKAIADWRSGFRAAGIYFCAVPTFQALFGMLVAAPRRALDVRCPSCQQLGLDEARLLQIVSLLQHAQTEAAHQLLADWMKPAAARMALLPAKGLADAMASADLFIPLRHRDAAMACSARTQPGLTLVH